MESNPNVEKINYRDIGVRIKECRIQFGMTQEKLAELANISIQHMSNIEHGATKLSLPTIIALANALAVSVDRLVAGSIHTAVGKECLSADFNRLIEDCTAEEAYFLYELVKSAKAVLRTNRGVLK